MGFLNRILKRIALRLIKLYQYAISPLFPASCRFYPSCSNYCIEAIESHGVFKGSYLFILRVLKCHPWHPGGIDMVPGKDQKTCSTNTCSLNSGLNNEC